MRLTRVVAKNFKVLRDVNLELNPGITILVGDNETGKSTLLEAIHLVLTGLLYGRLIGNELAPHLFNARIKSFVSLPILSIPRCRAQRRGTRPLPGMMGFSLCLPYCWRIISTSMRQWSCVTMLKRIAKAITL